MGNFIPVEPEKWAEMVKALAAVERLKAEVERLTAQVSYDNRTQLHVDKLAAEFTQYEVEKLRAEVERLREAGDDLVRHIEWRNVVITVPTPFSFYQVHPECLCNRHNFDEVIKAWNAAKEGKQS